VDGLPEAGSKLGLVAAALLQSGAMEDGHPNCPTQAKRGRLEWATCPKACSKIRLQQPIEKLDVNELVSDGRLRVAEYAGNHGVSLKATPQPNPLPQDKSPPSAAVP